MSEKDLHKQSEITEDNKKEAISRPADFFSKPKDILMNQDLNLAEKEQALWSWKTDVTLESIAIEENMKGNDINDNIVSEIDDALREVHRQLKDSNIQHPSPSKLGGF